MVVYFSYVLLCMFQSTPSGGKATLYSLYRVPLPLFQSTPSGGKATKPAHLYGFRGYSFNPRLPGGRRRGG